MNLFKFQIYELCKPGGLAERFQVSIRVLGQLDLLDEDLKALLRQIMVDTRNRTGGFINCCVAYTSRDEIVTAMSRAVRSSQLKHSSADITDEVLTRYMYTADDPAVDVLVRTSGVSRLSDFLLWQCHEDTDIQIVDAMWPEFGIYHLFLVIVRWQRKQMNIGQANIQTAVGGVLIFLVSLVAFMVMCTCISRGTSPWTFKLPLSWTLSLAWLWRE